MTAKAPEELDGCRAEEAPALAEPCPGRAQEDEAAAWPRLAGCTTWPHASREPAAEGGPASGVDASPRKMDKEPGAKGAPGPGKERLKAGAAPRSAPARKKVQAAPPPQPPPPPPAPSDELPWGDVSLNKCLMLASLVALLGSTLQLCRDAVAGEAAAPAPAPEPWIPPSPPRKAPVSPPPKPVARAPPSQTPAPKAEAGDRPEGPGDQEAAEKVEEPEPEPEPEPEEDTGEKAEDGPAPLAHRGPQEKARKERPGREERPRKERPRKEEKPWKEERPRKERPRAAREPGETAPRRWEAREGGRRPWARDSRDREHRKKQAWASPRPQAEEDRPPGRQKHRQGKGRD